MKKVIFIFLIFFGCSNYIEDNSKMATVSSIETSIDDKYKYCVHIRSKLGSTELYTNTKFSVGDTVKFIPADTLSSLMRRQR